MIAVWARAVPPKPGLIVSYIDGTGVSATGLGGYDAPRDNAPFD